MKYIREPYENGRHKLTWIKICQRGSIQPLYSLTLWTFNMNTIVFMLLCGFFCMSESLMFILPFTICYYITDNHCVTSPSVYTTAHACVFRPNSDTGWFTVQPRPLPSPSAIITEMNGYECVLTLLLYVSCGLLFSVIVTALKRREQ